jgi:leucyl aminopeptidase
VNVRFVAKSDAPARAVPVAAGAEPPKSERAAARMFRGRTGEVAEVGGNRRRVLLLGLGEGDDFEAAGALAVARLSELPQIALDARGLAAEAAVRLATGAVLRAWRYERLLTRPTPPHALPERPRVERIDVMVEDAGAAEAAWAAVAPSLEGVRFARDLVVEPSNGKPPLALAERLRGLEAEGIEVDVLDAAALRGQGLGALLAVGSASVHEPCLVVMRWRGSLEVPPVALIGKGVTFDTGGINLKPGQGMWEMRADMAGAAACAGAMIALARRRSPAPVTAVLPLAENAIGATSYRPSDVLRTFDGTTVEVVDTDAEGRLVLADAIGWALAKLKPQAIIDLATLTGSIVTALGHHMAGLFSSDDALAAHVAAAGAAVGEPCWRMPLGEGFREALRSDIADLRHCSDGSRQPDASHAAEFLKSFVGDTPWAHLDIAGVEGHEHADDRHPAGPTGWGVRLLDRLIEDRFEGA